MQPEHSFWLKITEQIFRQHAACAAEAARRRAFFGGLEHEDDSAGKIFALRRQHGRGRHQHRDVRVVTARVHDADVLAVVLTTRPRTKRQIALFLSLIHI